MSTYALIASPLVGAITWEAVADRLRASGHDALVPSVDGVAELAPPRTPKLIDAVAAQLPSDPIVLVGHSAAGVIVPQLTARADVAGVVLVDAQLAPRRGSMALAEGWFLDHVRSLAVDGELPPWSEWWGDDAMAAILPDDAQRAELVTAMPRLPLAWFEETVEISAGWDDRPCAYVQLSEVYDAERDEAEARGWSTTRIDGHHLDLVTRPELVADAIRRSLGV